MHHLNLARSKSENDASSTKILSRRIELWIRLQFGNLFIEFKALLVRLKEYTKCELDDFKAFDKKTESSETSKALQGLSDTAKGGALSTFDKVIIYQKVRTAL